jgi:hypothetical protein
MECVVEASSWVTLPVKVSMVLHTPTLTAGEPLASQLEGIPHKDKAIADTNSSMKSTTKT